MAKKNRPAPEINAGSMADIAFLLLIFFLVTTTIASDKGLPIRLPPKKDEITQVKLNKRNVFSVLVNSQNMLLVEEQPMNIKDLKETAKKFILNNGKDVESSESPIKAIISLKTDRGTNYAVYLAVMDEIKRAYNEIRAEKMGISVADFLELDNDAAKAALNPKYELVKKEIPYQLSEAEPTSVGK